MKFRKEYKFFILGSYGQFNMGDDGLLEVMKENLKDHQLVFNSDNPSLTEERFKVKAVYTYPQKDFWAKIKTFFWCDAIVYGGGTVIVQNLKILVFMFLGNFLARIFRKKVIYLGVGVGYLQSYPFLQKLAKLVCLTANLMTLRDQGSFNELKKIGVRMEKIRVTADPVLLLKPINKIQTQKILKIEGINKKNHLVGLSPRFHGFQKEYENFIKQLRKAADYLLSHYQVTLILIPIQWAFNYSSGYQWKYDEIAIKEFFKSFKEKKNVFFIGKRKYLPREIAGIIGSLDFYISSPLHSLMVAFTQGVPMIATNYSSKFDHKISQFMKLINQEEFMVDYSQINFVLLKEKIDQSFETLNFRKKFLQERQKKIINNARLNFNLLFKIMEESKNSD